MKTAKELRKMMPLLQSDREKDIAERELENIDRDIMYEAEHGRTKTDYQLSELNQNITKIVVDTLKRLGYTVEVTHEICLSISWGE